MDVVESLNPTVFGLLLIGAFTVILLLARRRKLRSWHYALWFLSFIAAFMAFAVARYLVLESRLDPFDAHLSEYTTATEYQPGDPYIRGKLLPMDIRQGTIDFVFYQELPRDLRAASPEEVGTVVNRDCVASSVGTYTRGGGAYRWACELKLIDLSISRILKGPTITGSEPPPTKMGSGDEYGSDPLPEIVAYLVALPRR